MSSQARQCCNLQRRTFPPSAQERSQFLKRYASTLLVVLCVHTCCHRASACIFSTSQSRILYPCTANSRYIDNRVTTTISLGMGSLPARICSLQRQRHSLQRQFCSLILHTVVVVTRARVGDPGWSDSMLAEIGTVLVVRGQTKASHSDRASIGSHMTCKGWRSGQGKRLNRCCLPRIGGRSCWKSASHSLQRQFVPMSL